MTAVINKISVGAGGKHTLSPEESLRRSVSFGKLVYAHNRSRANTRVPLQRRRQGGRAPEHHARALRCNAAGPFKICFLRACVNFLECLFCMAGTYVHCFNCLY